MKTLVALVVVAATIAGPASAAVGEFATATVAPARAAHVATLTVRLHSELQCGRLRPGRVLLRLPRHMRIPAAPVVTLAHVPVAGVTVAGHTVSFAVPPSPGMTCMAIAPGTVVVTVAGVRNPAAGRYSVGATVGGRTFTARLAVSA